MTTDKYIFTWQQFSDLKDKKSLKHKSASIYDICLSRFPGTGNILFENTGAMFQPTEFFFFNISDVFYQSTVLLIAAVFLISSNHIPAEKRAVLAALQTLNNTFHVKMSLF